jgi:hypothetical protein
MGKRMPILASSSSNDEKDELKEAGSSDDTPASFWVHDVPSDCLLRQVGIRVMSAKPSSTAVERCGTLLVTI